MRPLRSRGRCRRGLRLSGRASRAAHPRVLLIAPPNSYRIGPYLAAARRLGAQAVVASEGRHALIPEVAEGIQVEFSAPRAALERIKHAATERAFSAVIATDDASVELAGHVGAALGLPHTPPQAARTARRKDLARRALAAAGLPVPAFRRIDLTGDLSAQIRDVGFPCVVKPLALSASRGVIRADDVDSLRAACARIAKILEGVRDPVERTHVVVEDFLPGVEVAVEGMLTRGALQPLALFDKPDPLDGPFFEETYYVTPSRLSAQHQQLALRRVAQACRAYGLQEGPVHAELRLDRERSEAWVLEVAARTIGGECARLLRFGTGRSLEELVVDHAMGRPLAVQALPEAAGVLMIPIPRSGILRRVEGVLEAGRVPGVTEVSIAVREGYELVPLPEGASYLGFVFARAPTPDAVEKALRRAHAQLDIVVAPLWHLQPA